MAQKFLQVGDKYYVGDGSQLQQTTESDIRGRMGDISSATYSRFGVPQGDWRALLQNEAFSGGGILKVDPTQIQISPDGEVSVGGSRLQLAGSAMKVPAGTTFEQFTGLPFNQDFTGYLKETGQTYSGGQFSGTGAGPGGLPAGTATPPTQVVGQQGSQSVSGGQQGQYIQFAGSPDVFDSQTGKVVSYAEAQKIPDFFSKVQKLSTPRPEVRSEADYQTYSGKPLSTNVLPQVQQAIQGQGTQPTQDELVANAKALGLSDATIGALGDQGVAMFATLGEALKKQYEQNYPVPQVFTQQDLDRIFSEAQNDPTINEYYKNQLRTGQEEFRRNVAYVQQDFEALQQLQQRQFPEQQRALAEAESSAGRAYSGFAEKARRELAESQSGVIQSSKRDLQRQLEQLGGGFEQKFGTTALGQAPIIGGQTYQPYGSIPGQLEQQKLADIRALEQQKIQKESITRGLTT